MSAYEESIDTINDQATDAVYHAKDGDITYVLDGNGNRLAAIVPPHVADFYERAIEAHESRMVGDILSKVDSGEEQVLTYEDAFPADDDNDGRA